MVFWFLNYVDFFYTSFIIIIFFIFDFYIDCIVSCCTLLINAYIFICVIQYLYMYNLFLNIAAFYDSM